MTKAPDIEDTYVADFKAFSENGASAAPQWLRQRRSDAIEQFVRLGFPTGRDEAWRFTNVAPLIKSPFAPMHDTGAEAIDANDLQDLTLGRVGERRVVFVNGRFRPDLSAVDGLEPDIEVGSLAQAIANGVPQVEHHLGRYVRASGNPFTALATAFVADGAFISVREGRAIDSPLLVLYVTTPEAGGRVSHPRNLFLVGAGGAATLVEKYVTLGDASSWTNAVTEVVLGEGARLDAYRLQQESEQAFHTATTQSYQHRDSTFTLGTVVLGGALCRHDIKAVLDGPGAECTLHGLSQLRGRQHVDHHTTIEHAQPHCNSWEYFNGIYDDRARGVFTGRIIVRPGAQRTDSKQTNNSLLLSEHARADSQPQLEIYADDVKCTHGATLGPIDERSLFYLRSRGLTQPEARNLLTYGFGAEILGKVQIPELRDRLDRLIKARLAESSTWSLAPA